MILVRTAREADMPAVHGLISELAAYEKAPLEVTNTVEAMIRDGFGQNPVFYCQVAELEGKIVGMAIYFIKYSTWKGKGVYLDDIVVTESFRKQGIGAKLLDAVIRHSAELGANQLHWQVLDWNTPAIEFYKKYDVQFDAEWINCKMSAEQIAAYIKSGK
jgi:GNAT superfamily N-acetyltransferase